MRVGTAAAGLSRRGALNAIPGGKGPMRGALKWFRRRPEETELRRRELGKRPTRQDPGGCGGSERSSTG